MKQRIIPIILGMLTFTACNSWLDIKPETEVELSELFSTQDGFEEALLGVYTRCTQSDLYGKELTIGTPEVLAQNYAIAAHDPFRYLHTRNFEYDNADFIYRKDNSWKGLYHAIANCNLILEYVDGQQRLFAPGYHDLIKGEALALRAYLHFDALRLFANAFVRGSESPGVPYVTEYTNRTTKVATVGAALDSAVRDLEAAKVLLANDPIRNPGYVVGYPSAAVDDSNTEEDSPALFLQNRRHRMNYFAVCGTLARIYLYKGDLAAALENAQEVIVSDKFPWTNATDFLAVDDDKKDRIGYKELVFGWYVPGRNDDFNSNWFRGLTSGMYLTQDAAQAIYEVSGVGGTDLRYRQWFSTVATVNAYVSEIHKYRRNPLGDGENANLHYLMAPAIRLSEMHYIAAECTYPQDPAAAMAYIDEVRLHRGIGEPLAATDAAAFTAELLKEYRKELFAEGQLFFAYKRLNWPIQSQGGTAIAPSDAIFTWPLPDDEIIYGER